MTSAEGKVVLLGAGYWRPDGIGGSLRRRGVDLWLDWHDNPGFRDSMDWFDVREQAIREGTALLLYLPDDRSFSPDKAELTRLAASRGMPLFAFRTSATASCPPFINELNAVVYDFFGSAAQDEELLDQLASRLGGAF